MGNQKPVPITRKQRRQPLGWVAPLLPESTKRPTIFFVLGTLRPMSGLSRDLIEHALNTAQQNGYRFVNVKVDGERFMATFEAHSAPETVIGDVPDMAAVEQLATMHDLKAGSVGYVSLADLAIGDVVEAGQSIGAVTALGLRHDIVSSKSGTLAEILVEDGAPVEFGQLVAKVAI